MVQKDINRFNKLILTGFYSGFSPIAPGTFGTIVAIPFSLFFNIVFNPYFYLFFIIFLIVYGSIISAKYEKIKKEQDPSEIVFDEIIGFMIATFKIKLSFPLYITAFVIFRIFDITKILFIKKIENSLPSGLNIILDDCVAGIYTLIIIKIVMYFIK